MIHRGVNRDNNATCPAPQPLSTLAVCFTFVSCSTPTARVGHICSSCGLQKAGNLCLFCIHTFERGLCSDSRAAFATNGRLENFRMAHLAKLSRMATIGTTRNNKRITNGSSDEECFSFYDIGEDIWISGNLLKINPDLKIIYLLHN